ncbi:MAG: YoaP domain-containing protein [Methanosarcinaceae archaeon]|nr:YoaP domain-containing protein [Methanosarcinaceae archaeon]
MPSVYGTFSVFYNGEFLIYMHERGSIFEITG